MAARWHERLAGAIRSCGGIGEGNRKMCQRSSAPKALRRVRSPDLREAFHARSIRRAIFQSDRDRGKPLCFYRETKATYARGLGDEVRQTYSRRSHRISPTVASVAPMAAH